MGDGFKSLADRKRSRPRQELVPETLNNLAQLKYRMGDLNSANQILDRVLAGEETLLAGNEYDIQVSLSNKAAILVAQGHFQDAENVLRDVIRMLESAFGPIHPSTLFSIEALANILEKKGGFEAATSLHQRISAVGVFGF